MKVLRILVVEDDAMIALLLAEMFAAMGHDVCAIEFDRGWCGGRRCSIQARPDDRRCAIGR